MALIRYEGSSLSGDDYNNNLDYFENNKVDKIDGKGLSVNDLTNDLLDKLNNIESEANKYIHPTHTIDDIDGLNTALDSKQNVIDDNNKLPLANVENGNKVVLLDNNGDLPNLNGVNLSGVVKPKVTFSIIDDLAVTSNYMNNILVVESVNEITNITIPKASDYAGQDIIITSETDKHIKIESESKINNATYYVMIEKSSMIQLISNGVRWNALVTGNVYNDLYLSK